MPVYSNLDGTSKNSFGIRDGARIVKETSGLSVKDSTETNLEFLKVKKADGTDDNHVVVQKNLTDTEILSEWDFDGSSPPAFGSNTGKKGICHTSGGAYNAGQVYYDTGSAFVPTPIRVGIKLTTTTAITGTVSLIANGIYAAHAASAPFSWTLKGDGTGSETGMPRFIGKTLDNSATQNSTTNLADGDRIRKVIIDVTTPYSAGATGSVIVDGTSDLTLVPTSEIDLTKEKMNIFYIEKDDGLVTSSTAGPISFLVGGTPAAGVARLEVEFVRSYLA